MPTKVKLVLRYNTNFTLNKYTKVNYINTLTQQKLNKKIYCKNFLFLFLLLEFLYYKTKEKTFITYSVISNSKKKHKLTYLRAPNRAKSSQVNLLLPRYVINLHIKLVLTSLKQNVLNINNLITYLLIFQKQFNFFESNLLNLTAFKVMLKYHYKKL